MQGVCQPRFIATPLVSRTGSDLAGNRHAIYAQGWGLPAIWVEGNMHVTGEIYKGACSYRVDHPLDPENKYLEHASVESAERLNLYSGNEGSR